MKKQMTPSQEKSVKKFKKMCKKPARKWYSISKPMMCVTGVFVCIVLPFLLLGANLYQPILVTSMNSLYGPNDEPVVSKETRKSLEMLNVIVRIAEIDSVGSGVLLCKIDTNKEGIFDYFVVTNHHVVMDREVEVLESVDGLRGTLDFALQDIGCKVTVFSESARIRTIYEATIVSESPEKDLALVHFSTTDDIRDVAKVATRDMMAAVKIFDETFAVGCQLGRRPIPTVGIISSIFNREKFVGFSHTAQISPGSSGGGLFKKCGDSFYLIGIPSMVAGYGFQFVPHYGYAISTNTLRDFLCANDMGFVVNDTCGSE